MLTSLVFFPYSFRDMKPALVYMLQHQKEIFERTMEIPQKFMAGAPEVITLNMHFMRLIKAKRVLDVGMCCT